MAAPPNEFAFDLAAALAAAERWSEREDHHETFEEASRNKQYSKVDTAERCAARTNRLLGRLRVNAPASAEVIGREFQESMGADFANSEVTPKMVSDALLERVIGMTRDFQFVEFLEMAVFVSKSVGRVETKLGGGRVSFGTGFMVSPRLLMTNHHVLTSADDAAKSTIEFDFQRDRRGKVMRSQKFQLDPTTFFLNDKKLDFALVAVSLGSSGRPLRDYGWCPLRKDPGKIITGEPINIIQHPKGELKQVVIRENRLLDAFDGADIFYHYEADTEPGSSGSPVFNDQWEVVALHHSGVPRRNKKGELLDIDGTVWREGGDPSRLDWVANEGVRISKLVEFISKASVSNAAKPLLKEFLEPKLPVESESDQASVISPDIPSSDTTNHKDLPMSDCVKPSSGCSVTMTVPLHITLSFGVPAAGTTSLVVGPTATPDEGLLEKVEPDPSDTDYERRPGYESDFLGLDVPFPKLTNASRPKAYVLDGEGGDDATLIKYHHYSVIFNRVRKLAFVAGVNYDPTAKVQHPRDKDGDKWFYDPRVTPEKELQAGEALYVGNPLDRGHLVRRADAGWGATKKEAKLANDDTFHFTNCSPQHEITNQGKVKEAPSGLKLWGKLEDHVASQGKTNKRKLCIFNGPVFRKSDVKYLGIQLPKEFWKVEVLGVSRTV